MMEKSEKITRHCILKGKLTIVTAANEKSKVELWSLDDRKTGIARLHLKNIESYNNDIKIDLNLKELLTLSDIIDLLIDSDPFDMNSDRFIHHDFSMRVSNEKEIKTIGIDTLESDKGQGLKVWSCMGKQSRGCSVSLTLRQGKSLANAARMIAGAYERGIEFDYGNKFSDDDEEYEKYNKE